MQPRPRQDDAPPIRLDVVSDIVCPWCVIGYHQLRVAIEATGVEAQIHWHPFELNPHMPSGGENLREHLAARYGTTPEGSRDARARLTALGAELGFRFRYADDMRMFNTNAAHRLVHWATSAGKGHEMTLALFGAYFTDRRAIDQLEVLADVAASLGLDGEASKRAMTSPEIAQAVASAEATWTSRGIRGVPSVLVDGQHLIGGARGVTAWRGILEGARERQGAAWRIGY